MAPTYNEGMAAILDAMCTAWKDIETKLIGIIPTVENSFRCIGSPGSAEFIGIRKYCGKWRVCYWMEGDCRYADPRPITDCDRVLMIRMASYAEDLYRVTKLNQNELRIQFVYAIEKLQNLLSQE